MMVSVILFNQAKQEKRDYSDNREGIVEGTKFSSQNSVMALSLVVPGDEVLKSVRWMGTLFGPVGSPIYHLMKTMDSANINSGRK